MRPTTTSLEGLGDTILSNTPDLAYVFDLDHRFTYANDVLLRMWGKTWDEAIGKNCLELGYEPWHAEMHDREIEQVIATKQPIRGEVPFAGTFGRRIYDYIFVPVLDENGNVKAIAGTTRDVTERKMAELRNRFLLALDDALRPLSDPREITQAAARVLGEHLGADRCAYADVEADADTVNLTGNYVRGPEIKSIVGRLKFADFGAELLQLMREDKLFVVNDIATHQPPVADPAPYRTTQVQAIICVPLHKAGRLVAAMAVHMTTPRQWTADEVELVQAVAARCWESIERARLERGLLASESHFRAFVTASSDIVYRMSPDWSVMSQLAGRDFIPDTADPSRGWLEKYIHPEDHAMVLAAIGEAVRTKSTFELEHRVIRVDGTLGWTFSRAIPLLDDRGEIIEWFGAATDVSERRRAEAALRASEERYRSLFDSIDEGFCVIEVLFDETHRPVDYLFHEVNPAFESQAGMHNVTGKRMLEFVSDIEPHWLENYGRVAVTGLPIRFAAEYKSLASWFDVYAFRVGEAGSNRVAVLFNNITQRQRAEEALRASEERARAASAAKDDFLAQLSHELRTPLTPVLMTAAELSEDARLPADAREQLAMIERNVALEARLIDDLLDLTRITRGKLALRTGPCDVHALLNHAIEIVHDEAREKGVGIALDLAAARSCVSADPVRLQQVFWNLLRNAVKFTPAGGHVHVRSRDAEPADAGSESRRICLEVSDDGIGFTPELAGRLFEPFEQGVAAGDQRFPGLGLGLAIARAIVDLHGGSIHAKSDGPGKGATFTVNLPGGEPPAVDIVRPVVGEFAMPAEPPLRLLLVEDHEPTLNVLARFLTRAGHQVTTASSLAESFAAAEKESFDAVISDLGLPDGTGIELMAQLRERHGLRGIALSGYGMDEDVNRSLAAGFVAHLTKPVDINEVRRALHLFAAVNRKN